MFIHLSYLLFYALITSSNSYVPNVSLLPWKSRISTSLKRNTLNNVQLSLSKGFGSSSTPTKSKKSNQDKNTSKQNTRSFNSKNGNLQQPLRGSTKTYDSIINDDGGKFSNDIYVRNVLDDRETFWFVGKVARREHVSEQDAVKSHKRLIMEYSKRYLRPQNLAGANNDDLELWIAPGNTEMDVVQNKISLVKVEGSTASISEDLDVRTDVGYNPEIYVGDELKDGGLRVKRDDEGRPLKDVFEVKTRDKV